MNPSIHPTLFSLLKFAIRFFLRGLYIRYRCNTLHPYTLDMGEGKKNPRDRTAEEESSTLGRVDVHTYMDDNRKNIANAARAHNILSLQVQRDESNEMRGRIVKSQGPSVLPQGGGDKILDLQYILDQSSSIHPINHQPIQLIHPSACQSIVPPPYSKS